jgi:hypothetical protein
MPTGLLCASRVRDFVAPFGALDPRNTLRPKSHQGFKDEKDSSLNPSLKKCLGEVFLKVLMNLINL